MNKAARGLVEATPTSAAHPRHDPAERGLELVARIAYWMDQRYVDPLLALVLPGAGDVIGAAIGVLTIVVAFRSKAHPALIARMFINLALDALLGSIPLLGPVIDFFYRAHTRNLHLLEQRAAVREARASDWLVVAGAALAFVIALCLPVVLIVALVRLL
jgi:Domain of unknown function (DUF4112)